MSRFTRYEPMGLLKEVNKLLEENFHPWAGKDTSNIDTSQWIPAVDIKEEDLRFVILADLPGIDKKDLNISMENNILTIKGQRESETNSEHDHYSRIERVRGSFYRRFSLPDSANNENIQAKIKNGVLEIIIPKRKVATSRLIEVQGED